MFEFRFYEIWRTPEYLERLASGLTLSIGLTTAAAIFGFVFAIALALCRRGSNPALKAIAASYIEVVRNTPLIVQLFFVAFGLPMLLDYRWPFAMSALLALTLNFAAYYAEIVRAGLDNIDRGQHDASMSLGLRKVQTLRLIVLPQAIASVYPSLVSQFIFLYLTTGIISELGIEELTWSGRFIADRTFRDFEVFIVLSVLYVIGSVLFRVVLELMGKRLFPWRSVT